MADDFATIPILDLSLAQSPTKKPLFLSELRNALVRVGFFYVKNHSIAQRVRQDVLRQSMAFFSLPLKSKLEIKTEHSKCFVGYNKMDAEMTDAGTDHNESIVIGPDLPAPVVDEPVYRHIQGPNQWPNEAVVPGFRDAFENYRSAVASLAADFTVLIAEALDLAPSSLTRFFNDSPYSSLKVRKYSPPPGSGNCQQGIGAHKDGAFMTYLLQGGEHSCLEVQNKSGAWISVPPIPGTLVVNIGRLLEVLTHGVCTATTHRVNLSPESFIDSTGRPRGPRLSIPFFQHVNLDLGLEDLSLDLSPHITSLVEGEKVTSDVNKLFLGLYDNCVGDALFVNKLTSYPDVARKWYPGLLPLALEKQYGA